MRAIATRLRTTARVPSTGHRPAACSTLPVSHLPQAHSKPKANYRNTLTIAIEQP
jgi:hypothetical protein